MQTLNKNNFSAIFFLYILIYSAMFFLISLKIVLIIDWTKFISLQIAKCSKIKVNNFDINILFYLFY